jgi:hypothetical protein
MGSEVGGVSSLPLQEARCYGPESEVLSGPAITPDAAFHQNCRLIVTTTDWLVICSRAFK